jgi:hypothetical protein
MSIHGNHSSRASPIIAASPDPIQRNSAQLRLRQGRRRAGNSANGTRLSQGVKESKLKATNELGFLPIDVANKTLIPASRPDIHHGLLPTSILHNSFGSRRVPALPPCTYAPRSVRQMGPGKVSNLLLYLRTSSSSHQSITPGASGRQAMPNAHEVV